MVDATNGSHSMSSSQENVVPVPAVAAAASSSSKTATQTYQKVSKQLLSALYALNEPSNTR